MELADPVEHVRDQEILDFGLSEIEDLRSPVRMFTAARIRIFINALPVKTSQSMLIRAEMRGYPVENHADAVLMQRIH